MRRKLKMLLPMFYLSLSRAGERSNRLHKCCFNHFLNRYSPTIHNDRISTMIKHLFASTLFACAIVLGSNAISRADSGILYAHEGHNHASDSGDAAIDRDNHVHGTMEIPAGQPILTVSLIVHPDTQQGWNLEIQTTNFGLLLSL